MLISQESSEVDTVVNILWIRKLRQGEVDLLGQVPCRKTEEVEFESWHSGTHVIALGHCIRLSSQRSIVKTEF